MGKIKVAFIGAGQRAGAYAKRYAPLEHIEIVAFADPQPIHRKLTMERSQVKNGCAQYDDWRDMMKEHQDLDGVVITTPNYLHEEPAVACLERGLPIALEKPLAHAKEACERIIDAERANNGRTLIGFVLRSQPMYMKAHELIESGAIGRLVSLQADELPGWGVSSNMHRQPWRRFESSSGGAMLEKCCHDMDILNWMMGCRPMSLSSYGGQLIFNPSAALPERCNECNVSQTCRYYMEPQKSVAYEEGDDGLQNYIRSEYACIYNVTKDIVDAQSIAIEYENGSLANFMLNFNCAGPRASRNIHAIGQKGRIWGNLHECKLYHYDNQTEQLQTFDTTGDGSGHGGGDSRHAMELIEMIKDPQYRPGQNAEAGYLSAVMCFAADISRVQRRRVDFRYSSSGRIDAV